MRITIILAILFSGFIFLTSCNLALAQENIGKSQIHPAHPLYFLKTIREKLEMKFADTTNLKTVRQLEFSTRRIREVNSLVATKNQQLIEPTLEKYWQHLKYLINNTSIADVAFLNEVRIALSKQIASLQTAYAQIDNKRAKMAVRLALFRLSQWDFAKLTENFIPDKDSICIFLAREASASGLNDVEKVVLEERAQKCFGTLR